MGLDINGPIHTIKFLSCRSVYLTTLFLLKLIASTCGYTFARNSQLPLWSGFPLFTNSFNFKLLVPSEGCSCCDLLSFLANYSSIYLFHVWRPASMFPLHGLYIIFVIQNTYNFTNTPCRYLKVNIHSSMRMSGPRQAKLCIRACANCADSDHPAPLQCIIGPLLFVPTHYSTEWLSKRKDNALIRMSACMKTRFCKAQTISWQSSAKINVYTHYENANIQIY